MAVLVPLCYLRALAMQTPGFEAERRLRGGQFARDFRHLPRYFSCPAYWHPLAYFLKLHLDVFLLR